MKKILSPAQYDARMKKIIFFLPSTPHVLSIYVVGRRSHEVLADFKISGMSSQTQKSPSVEVTFPDHTDHPQVVSHVHIKARVIGFTISPTFFTGLHGFLCIVRLFLELKMKKTLFHNVHTHFLPTKPTTVSQNSHPPSISIISFPTKKEASKKTHYLLRYSGDGFW